MLRRERLDLCDSCNELLCESLNAESSLLILKRIVGFFDLADLVYLDADDYSSAFDLNL